MATLTKGKTFAVDETVTASKLHQLVDSGTVADIVDADIKSTAAIAPEKLDDHSASVAEMRETADPGEDGTESQATSMRDEIKRLRFMFLEYSGLTYWYESLASAVATLTGTEILTNKTIDGDNNTISNLAHGAEVDNPSTGVHGVTGNVEDTNNKNAVNGYPGLDGSSKLTGSQQVYGTGVNTACVGNDSRLSDSRTPTAHTTSHQPGQSDPLLLDEDNMATNSAALGSSQQALKAFVTSGTVAMSNKSLVAPSSDDLTLTGSAASPPDSNTLTKENIIKGWIQYDQTGTTTINGSFNVSGIVDNGVGIATISWDTNFANNDYVCPVTCGVAGATASFASTPSGDIAVGSIQIRTFNTSDVLADMDVVHAMACGDQ